MSEPTIVTWDWKAQPDWAKINFALTENIDAFIHEVETGCDSYAVVIGSRDMTQAQAKKAFDEWYQKG